MMKTARALVWALVVLGLSVGAVAAQDMYVGTVTRIDQPAQVIVFEDGRMYRVAPNTVLLYDNQPVMYTTLRPGTRVVVRGGPKISVERAVEACVLLQPAMERALDARERRDHLGRMPQRDHEPCRGQAVEVAPVAGPLHSQLPARPGRTFHAL